MSDAKTLLPKKPTWKLGLVLSFAVIVLWFANWIIVYCWPERGTFGDMFGAVNALFTGAAFGAVIYAIAIQRHEVGLLKQELDRSKVIVEKQQMLADIQIAAQQKQQFEATFFNLLQQYSNLVEGMDLRSTDKPDVVGKDVFPVFLERAAAGQTAKISGITRKSWKYEAENLLDRYDAFYLGVDNLRGHASELGHYFRTVYNIVKFVDRKGPDGEKKDYTNFLRAQLSDDEALLLCLNGVSDRGREKFRQLLIDYSLLKNVDKSSQIFQHVQETDPYPDEAFF